MRDTHSHRLNKILLLIVLLVIAATFACLHKSSPITPWERASADNAVFADANNTLEKTMEAVVNAQLLTPQQAAPVIQWTGKTAQAHKQMTMILSRASTITPSDYVALSGLLQDIARSGQALVVSGVYGIKNPNTQRQVSADIQAAITLAQSLFADVQTLKAKAPSPTPAPPSPHSGAFLLFTLFLPLAGMAVNWEEVVSLIVQLGPLSLELINKLRDRLNLTPDEMTNIANAVAASNAADDETMTNAYNWLVAHGIKPEFNLPSQPSPEPTPVPPPTEPPQQK